MSIKALQKRYIEEKDPSALSSLYQELIWLGLEIMPSVKTADAVDVYDLASSICMRLIESQKEVISSAPSAYIKLALYFSQKKKFVESLEDWVPSKERTPLYAVCMDEAKADMLDSIREECSEEVFVFVRATVESEISYKKIAQLIDDKAIQKEYRKTMEKLKTYAEKNLQG